MSDKTKRSIICDSCNSELIIDSSYPANFSLELRAINTGINSTGAQYAVCVHPPIDGPLHFCGKACLRNWVEKNT